VAKGSEQFTWKMYDHPRKICWECKKEPLRVEDVGEERTIYPSHKTEFRCKDCRNAALARAVEANRSALGLEKPAPRQRP